MLSYHFNDSSYSKIQPFSKEWYLMDLGHLNRVSEASALVLCMSRQQKFFYDNVRTYSERHISAFPSSFQTSPFTNICNCKVSDTNGHFILFIQVCHWNIHLRQQATAIETAAPITATFDFFLSAFCMHE